MLSHLLRHLHRTVARQAGGLLVYGRGAVSVQLEAIYGSQRMQVAPGSAPIQVSTTDPSFVLRLDDLAALPGQPEPQPDDWMERTEPGTGRVERFVLSSPGQEKPYTFVDGSHTLVRVTPRRVSVTQQ